ncbi:acid phosphatase, class B-like protein [Tanacetum coccineum]|uniref:Acid phosphatase, class B-like protein n=1 Tax=Tanacetum coccineum TaxID=301880 RepID=A0ABQ4XN58_9ASTR
MTFTIFFVLLTLATAVALPNDVVHLLKPHSGSAGHKHHGLNCLSWRLAVETNNLRNWTQVPATCEAYVGHYMLGKQYGQDCAVVTYAAYEYAKGLNLAKDGKDVWIFDIDETALSNLPYYSRDTIPYNETSFNAWVAEAVAPAVPASLKLYNGSVKLGFKIVFLTGSHDTFTEARIKNLKAVGYTTWEKLILKKAGEGSGVVYKSSKRKELVDAGYRIRGNIGDQWSDLLGSNAGDRTFKLPDPMYYIG